MSRAMADLLSNRADAYARFYFRVRARQGVVQRPVSVHLFFFFFSLHGIDAQRGRSFSSSAIKNSSGARPPLSSRLQVTHARCIFFYAVVIAVERSRRVCARSFRRVEKKRREGGRGRGRKKKGKTLAHFTHMTRRFSSRAGDKTPRDAQIIIRVAFSRLFAGRSLKTRAIR